MILFRKLTDKLKKKPRKMITIAPFAIPINKH